MNYQDKYLKYKSKYLEKKYGYIQIFSYKYNDLNYKQKYFKYKSKYLNIKYGGVSAAERAAAAASIAAIRKTNQDTTGLTGYINPKFAKEDEQNKIKIKELNKEEKIKKANEKIKNEKVHNEVKAKILQHIEDIGKYDYKDSNDNILINKTCKTKYWISKNKENLPCSEEIKSIIKNADLSYFDLSKEIDINSWLNKSLWDKNVKEKGYIESITRLQNWLVEQIVNERYDTPSKGYPKILLSSYIKPAFTNTNKKKK